MTTQLLTNSRREAFQVCRRKHWYSYELGVRKVDDAKALRMGTAGHLGVEILCRTGDLGTACEAVDKSYATLPEGYDALDWAYERETILRLICAYEWRWEAHKLTYLAVEREFELPLLNPQSGKPTPSFNLGGKMDGVVQLEDGRQAVKETKFLGEEIGADAPLWMRMKMDGQVSLYMIAARRLGFAVDTVLYDVVRKPTIRPEQIPIRDELGVKIVLDANGDRVRLKDGKKFRQTGDESLGYVLQVRPMTPDEWGEKLTADITARPEFYFCRNEIPRLNHELEMFEYELWDLQQTLRDAQRNDRWYRTVSKNTCPYCPYFGICSSGVDVSGALPEGFVRVYDTHPELQRENVNVSSVNATAPDPQAIEPAAASC